MRTDHPKMLPTLLKENFASVIKSASPPVLCSPPCPPSPAFREGFSILGCTVATAAVLILQGPLQHFKRWEGWPRGRAALSHSLDGYSAHEKQYLVAHASLTCA
ncbi:hypothetical protein CDAR_4181 [Caerostris darwini]|uniref:Uncharacterized protein n=1 Tax=Caerostris darwini TaxID=1538125 RepID=A0AAV4N4A2_9ARAC|nr:hypothetical protein CDAR_4181 [Caerostris darwini]